MVLWYVPDEMKSHGKPFSTASFQDSGSNNTIVLHNSGQETKPALRNQLVHDSTRSRHLFSSVMILPFLPSLFKWTYSLLYKL